MSGYGSGSYGSFSFGSSGSGGPEPPSGGVAAIPGWGGSVSVYVEIDFSQAVDGSGAGATSYVALWDSAVWDSDVWNAGTTWTNVTEWVQSVQTKSGFARLNGAYNAATATVVLRNLDGRFSPDNTSSPYRLADSTTIGIWRPIRIYAVYDPGATTRIWPLFTGWVRSWDEQFPLKGRDAVVTVEAVDNFGKLAAFENPAQTPVGASETTGARIGRILDAIGYQGDRFIDTGEHTCQATDLSGNMLSLAKLTADSEGGALWCGPDGAVYFDGLNALVEKERSNTVHASFADDGTAGALHYSDVTTSYDGDLVTNMVQWQRVGGSVQTVTSQTSRNLYGDRQSSRTDFICETDGQVLTLAQREVAIYQFPERRIESLRFSPLGQGSAEGTDTAWAALSEQRIQLRALLEVRVSPPGGFTLDRQVFVQGITHSITRTEWWVDLDFGSATSWAAQVDARWDSAVWDTSAWAWS